MALMLVAHPPAIKTKLQNKKINTSFITQTPFGETTESIVLIEITAIGDRSR